MFPHCFTNLLQFSRQGKIKKTISIHTYISYIMQISCMNIFPLIIRYIPLVSLIVHLHNNLFCQLLPLTRPSAFAQGYQLLKLHL